MSRLRGDVGRREHSRGCQRGTVLACISGLGLALYDRKLGDRPYSRELLA
jgi:hypothetical protein